MLNKSRLRLIFWLGLAMTGLGLCVWQLGRAQEKQQLIDLRRDRGQVVSLGQSLIYSTGLLSQGLDQQRVALTGKWIAEKTIFLDNRALEGRAGVHVLTPLVLSDGSLVWVNRGWMAKPPGVIQAPVAPSAAPAKELAGIALSSVMKRIELSNDPERLRQGALWQNFDWAAARDWLGGGNGPGGPGGPGGPVWPVIVWQSDDNGDGLIRKIPEVSSDVPKHLGYAAQWFLLTLVALFFAWRLGRKK